MNWEPVAPDGTERLPVPGGWIYRSSDGMTFVPEPGQRLSYMTLHHVERAAAHLPELAIRLLKRLA